MHRGLASSWGVGRPMRRTAEVLRRAIATAMWRDSTRVRASVDALEPRLLLAGNLSISEFMADNKSVLQDEDGQYVDWIEVHNSSGSLANLKDYFLTDNAANLHKWALPDVSIGANGYLVVFASNKDRAVAGLPLHTNFSLDSKGGYLALVEPDGVKVDSQYNYSQQESDISFGVDAASAGSPLRFFATPTPGAANARSEVVINEIHYDPDIKTEAIRFIELYNPGAAAVDLSGAAFTKGINYTFAPGISLPAGGYLTIAQNPTAFIAKFGKGVLGPYSGSLSANSDDLVVKNKSGGQLDEVDYQAGFPWPVVGEAPGYSIELINPNLDNSIGGNWRSHAPVATQDTTLVAAGSTWTYLKGTAEASNPVTAWRQLGFNDASWTSGASPIGYDPSVVMGTKLSDMNGGYTSFFMRQTFTVADPTQFASLRLEAQYDDGFNLWINGTHVIRSPELPADEMAYSAVTGSGAREDNSFITFQIPVGALHQGTNVIAVQVHNVLLSGSSDAFFNGRLLASAGGGGSSPTPGATNSVYALNAAPAMRQVQNSPQQPTAGQPVTITAKVTDPDGVSNVSLSYQLVDPGNYIAYTDAAYQTNWTAVAMHDDGQNGDMAAGDGIYTVVLPGTLQVNRRLVRYRITTTDSLGAKITAPYADDPQQNFAYFCYNGNSAWTGAAQPGVTTPVTYSAQVMNSLPTYILLGKQTDAEDATWNSHYGGSNYLWHGTMVYDGVVYEDVGFRARGGVWRYAMGKNAWKFNFNHDHGFQARDDYGNLYPSDWDKIDLRPLIQQGDFWHRGEQGLFESVSLKMFNLAGAPASNTTFIQFRIIDKPNEVGTTQYNGDLWGMYLAVENYDGKFQDQHNLPEGNQYDMEAGSGPGGGVLNNQGSTQPSNNSDLVNYANTYINTKTTDQWWRDNLNLQEYYSFRSIIEAVHDYDVDQGAGKNYIYYHNPITNQWSIFPWDLDLTWSDNMYGGGDEPYRSRVLSRSAFNLEYQNKLREIRDLLHNPDQTGQLIDEMAAKIYTPGQPSFIDVDRAMWDYNPVMVNSSIVNTTKAGQGRFYKGNPGAGVVIPAPGGFAGMMQKMKNYVVSHGSYIDTNLLTDTQVPKTPTISYTGTAGHPLDNLAFHTSAFSGTGGTFAAMQWRIAEVTDPNAPGYDPKAPKHFEINASWVSPELATFNSDVVVPPGAVEVGHTYRMRVKMKDSAGRWSHWSSAMQFVAGPSPSTVKDSLRIVEINYNPSAPPIGSPYTSDDFEFIEVKNISNQVVNLNGVKFTNGIDFTFPNMDLAAGESAVVVRNLAAFQSRYNTAGMKIAGAYGVDSTAKSNLDNGGEHILLEDSLGQTILDFIYDDTGPGWQPSTDGAGKTLVIIDPTAPVASWNDPASWRASTYLNGTPGADESTLAAKSVVVNEVYSNSGLAGDWIELFNTTNSPIDISGWYLSDSSLDVTKYQIAPGTILAAGAYLVLDEFTSFGNATAPGVKTPFALSQSGDDAFLSAANPFGVLNGYGYAAHFGAADPGVSLGRYINSVGTEDFTAMITPTPGAANSMPKVGPVVINELMYDPSVGGDEFIELKNITNAGVPLYDPANPSDTWRFTQGVQFTFPTGATLAGGQYALVVPIDPAVFRSKYNIGTSVQIFGPYTGSLNNTGERVEISKPAPPDVNQVVAYVLVDGLTYSDLAPWPTSPHGLGPSLGRIVATEYGNDPINWTAEVNGGSPGVPNLDTAPPTVNIVVVTPNPRTTAVASITIQFSEPVNGFDLQHLSLSRNGGANLLAGGATLSTADKTTWTLGNLSGLTFIEGSYSLQLIGGGITDLAGLPLGGNAATSFVVNATSLQGGSGSDTFGLRRVGSDLQVFQNVSIGSTPTYTIPLSSLTSLTIDGGDGDDTLTVDLSGGSPIPAGGLFFNGGNQVSQDTLVVIGAGGSGTYTPSGTTPGSGVVDTGNGAITFTGLEPVFVSGFQLFKFVTPNVHDDISLDTINGNGRISGTSSGTPFESLNFTGVATLTIDTAANDGAGGNDTITVGPGGIGLSLLQLNVGGGSNTLVLNGGTLNLDTNLGVGGDQLSVVESNSAILNLASAQKFASIGLNDSSKLNLAAGGGNTLWTHAVAIASGATLDVADNDLILQSTVADRDSALATVSGLIQSGRNGGAWSGKGIVSSAAAAEPSKLTGLAVALNDRGGEVPLYAMFDGLAIDTNAVLVKYTYNGDTDLNGNVDADDYFQIDNGFANSKKGYRNGDFDFNGVVDADDYFLIDNAFARQNGVFAAGGVEKTLAIGKRRHMHRHAAISKKRLE